MNVKFFNIKWDTSNDGFDDNVTVNLPEELIVDHISDDLDLELEGADVLSSATGFCVSSFDYEILEEY